MIAFFIENQGTAQSVGGAIDIAAQHLHRIAAALRGYGAGCALQDGIDGRLLQDAHGALRLGHGAKGEIIVIHGSTLPSIVCRETGVGTGRKKSIALGGPAICGVQDEFWIRSFMEFCRREKIAVDFITRHHYTTEFPENVGHYGYAALLDPKEGFANLQTTRNIVDSFEEYRGLEIHITEFNTSYVPNCPLHDTNQNAAYLALQLSRLGDMNESYSYWTFGDIFEEYGVPFTPFHGGFGLVANGRIPKPTFWTFKFFRDLEGKCVHKSDDMVVLQKEDGSFCGAAWNWSRTRTGKELEIGLRVPADKEEYVLITKIVDEETCNPLRLWHDLGEPSSLSEKQKKLLREAANPLITSSRVCPDSRNAEIKLNIREHGMVYFELAPVVTKSDRGYDYRRVMQYDVQ